MKKYSKTITTTLGVITLSALFFFIFTFISCETEHQVHYTRNNPYIDSIRMAQYSFDTSTRMKDMCYFTDQAIKYRLKLKKH